MSIKLLQINPSYKPAFVYGGPTMSVAKLCETLNENKIDLTVLTTTANGQTELPVKTGEIVLVDGVPVIYFKRITKDHTHLSPALLNNLRHRLRRLKSKKDIDVIVHIHSWWNLVAILSCQIAKWFNVPVILSPRGMLTDYSLGNRNTGAKTLIHSLMGKNLLRYCHIHATSEKEKEDILKFITPSSITVIPNLVNLPKQFEVPIFNQENNQLNLLFLSRIEEKKGLELLFEALSEVKINWKLTIAGSGREEYVSSLQQRCADLKIANQVIWLGHVANENKFQLMAKNDITVLTSYNENFANVVIESLRVGTPVLLSDQVGLADYVLQNDLGWITSLEKEAIKSSITEAYYAIDKRKKIKTTGPLQIEVDFQSNNLVHQYISLYQHALHV